MAAKIEVIKSGPKPYDVVVFVKVNEKISSYCERVGLSDKTRLGYLLASDHDEVSVRQQLKVVMCTYDRNIAAGASGAGEGLVELCCRHLREDLSS